MNKRQRKKQRRKTLSYRLDREFESEYVELTKYLERAFYRPMFEEFLRAALADDSVRQIVLSIDSPGGYADGTFELPWRHRKT